MGLRYLIVYPIAPGGTVPRSPVTEIKYRSQPLTSVNPRYASTGASVKLNSSNAILCMHMLQKANLLK